MGGNEAARNALAALLPHAWGLQLQDLTNTGAQPKPYLAERLHNLESFLFAEGSVGTDEAKALLAAFKTTCQLPNFDETAMTDMQSYGLSTTCCRRAISMCLSMVRKE